MARLVCVLLSLILLPAQGRAQSSRPVGPALSQQSAPTAPHVRDYALGQRIWSEPVGGSLTTTEIAPNTIAGVGIFGHKRDGIRQEPVTLHDITARHARRAGVGFTLKF